MVKKIQQRIEDVLTSIKEQKELGKSTSMLKRQLNEYKELLEYVKTSPDKNFIQSMTNRLRINIIRCEQKIQNEAAKTERGSLSKDHIKLIKSEFDYKNCVRRLKYLNFLLQD